MGCFYRLLVTVPNAELFTTAPKSSVLFKVSQNNLVSNPDINVKSMLDSSDLSAYFDSVYTVVEFEEYKNCMVSFYIFNHRHTGQFFFKRDQNH